MPRLLMLALGFAASLAATPTSAAVLLFTTALAGSNEVPPTATSGTGNATVTIDTVANSLRVQLTFAGLISPAAAAHIHCCAPLGTNAPVAVPFVVDFPFGVTSGTYDHLFDLTALSTYTAAFLTITGGTAAGAQTSLISGISTGQTYVNIHDATFPGGEIRGQLTPAVPELSTWAMMLAGFAVTGVTIRRRRRTLALA